MSKKLSSDSWLSWDIKIVEFKTNEWLIDDTSKLDIFILGHNEWVKSWVVIADWVETLKLLNFHWFET